jgi:hypothetical protein
VVLLPEVELVYCVAHVQVGRSVAFHLDLHVVIEVCVIANVEIAGDFLDSEGTDQPAPQLLHKGLPHQLQLFIRTVLPQ